MPEGSADTYDHANENQCHSVTKTGIRQGMSSFLFQEIAFINIIRNIATLSIICVLLRY
jgi:hypothetical protein